jgi:hypothetical protein
VDRQFHHGVEVRARLHPWPLIDYLERETRERIHIVGFGRRAGQPRKHGDFNDPPRKKSKSGEYPGARFWEPAFWDGKAN